MGLCIQNSDANGFYTALPKAITYYIAFGNNNYANVSELMLLQWISWEKRNHPAAGFLNEHFKATSEEFGEASISRLMKHVHDWNFSGAHLSSKYVMSGAAHSVFEFLDLESSYKTTVPKVYPVEKYFLSSRMLLVYNEFELIEYKVLEDMYYPFCLDAAPFKKNSPRAESLRHFRGLQDKLAFRFSQTIIHSAKILTDEKFAVFAEIEASSLNSVDLNNFMW